MELAQYNWSGNVEEETRGKMVRSSTWIREIWWPQRQKKSKYVDAEGKAKMAVKVLMIRNRRVERGDMFFPTITGRLKKRAQTGAQ